MKASKWNNCRDYIVRHPLLIIYVLSSIMAAALISYRGVLDNSPDAISYIKAIDSFLQGHLDVYRTPVYPFIIGCMRFLFGETLFLKATVIFQHLLFLISIWYFYHSALKLTSSPRLTFWISLFYGAFPYLNTWGNRIITESIAISLSVILIYYFIQLIVLHEKEKKNNEKKQSNKLILFSISFFITLLLLVFHRPIFIYLLPIFVLVFGVRIFIKEERETAVGGLIASVLVSICLLLYMGEFKREYGIFSTSVVSCHNNYANAIRDGMIENPDSTGFWEMSPKEMKEYTAEIYRSQPRNAAVSVFHRFFRAADFQLLFYRGTQDHLWINVGWIYMFLLLYGILLGYGTFKKKQMGWISVTLWMLCVSNIIVAVIGADNEYNRLILPSIPFILLMLGQLLAPIRRKSIESIKFL